jgi:hypothetical protein
VTTINLIPVAPTGLGPSAAIVHSDDGTFLDMSQRPTYPPSERGSRLRRERHAAHCSMGQLARAIGLRVFEVSALELGELTTDEAGWEACLAAVARIGGVR